MVDPTALLTSYLQNMIVHNCKTMGVKPWDGMGHPTMFRMKWRAKELLGVSQPHTSLFSDKSMWNQLMLKLYRLSRV